MGVKSADRLAARVVLTSFDPRLRCMGVTPITAHQWGAITPLYRRDGHDMLEALRQGCDEASRR